MLVKGVTTSSAPRCANTNLEQISLPIESSRSLTTEPSYASKYPDPSLYDPKKLPQIIRVNDHPKGLNQVSTVPPHISPPSVCVTLYSFPETKPLKLLNYPSTHLNLPLRKDILHRAVIYEGDKTRQGTASTKWRSEIHGSGKKVRPQKGTGRARLGDKKSPMLRGGGAAFGPKPRDFSTDLPRKIYDLAWRTALSHRYHRGELIVVDKLHILEEESELHMMEGEELDNYLYENQRTWNDRPRREPPELRMPGTEREVVRTAEYLKMFRQGEEKLRSLYVVKDADDKKKKQFQLRLWKEGKFKDVKTVDVKNLLELDRIVIEKAALDYILRTRQKDLKQPVNVVAARAQVEKDAKILKAALDEMKSSTEAEQTS